MVKQQAAIGRHQCLSICINGPTPVLYHIRMLTSAILVKQRFRPAENYERIVVPAIGPMAWQHWPTLGHVMH